MNESADLIKKNALGNFEQLLYSRHSFRYFAGIPDKQLIEKALILAQRTPSACNRQAWKTHVYYGENSINIIKWQGGAKGFEDEIQCCIIVTSSLKAFFDYEVHQAYVDGGLYAMNLINALHYTGLATIPLSLAFGHKKLEQLKEFGIPSHELPILIVGVGVMPQNPKLAISERKNISITNIFH